MPKIVKPEELTLSNGIPVILQHHDSNVAATYWWVKTGSADETPAEAGFAHFLEHMLFKDAAAKETGRASSGQMARSIESLGGDINAYTSFDQTVYHVTCAAQHWERVIDAFGTMAKPQKFLKTDFMREREVILEELRKNEDSPDRQLFQSLFSATYAKHPYGKPVIGFVKTLRAANVSKLEAFYRRNYVSGNMGLILVGPIQDEKGQRRKAIINQLEKYYGSRVLPRREGSHPVRLQEVPLRKAANLLTKTFDVKTPALSFAFRAPDLKHRDVPALDLICNVLATGELSRLYQRLFYDTSLATEVNGGLYIPRDPGMLYFHAEMDSVDKVKRVAEEMLKEIVRLREEGPTQEEIERVIANVESERLYATQTADGMASRLGFLRFILGDLDFDREYLEELRAVTKEKVQQLVAHYLVPQRMSGVLLLPKAESKFDIADLTAIAERILPAAPAPVSEPRPAKVKKSGTLPFELVTRPSGMRVIYRERLNSHVTSVHASVLGGLRLELGSPLESAQTDWGASYMMSLTWTKGSKKHNSKAIATQVEGSAAGLDGFAGRNSIGMQMTCLSRDWKKISELFTEVLVNPTFPEDEVDHSRRVAEESIRSIEDHSSQLCSKLFLETLFESHPYGKLTTGSLDSLRAIRQTKLMDFHRAWLRPERLVISVVGAIDRADVNRWLEDLEEQLLRRVSGFSPLKVVDALADEAQLRAPRWAERNLGREQTHLIIGGLGTRIHADDRHAVRLMQTLLGGQSGRLFVELREKKSLAYTVSPVSFEGMERGYIGTYIACGPGKRAEAVAGIQKVLEQLASKGPTATEMKRAKEFFLGRRAMELQSDSAIAAHYGLEVMYGLQPKTDDEMIRRVQKVAAKDIQAVCRRYLVEPPMVTSTVG